MQVCVYRGTTTVFLYIEVRKKGKQRLWLEMNWNEGYSRYRRVVIRTLGIEEMEGLISLVLVAHNQIKVSRYNGW